jgi:hypothetical protein
MFLWDVALLGIAERPNLVALDVVEFRLRSVRRWYSVAASPSSTSSFMIVFCANPVMRLVERMELPSTRARMICARSVRFSLFILR